MLDKLYNYRSKKILRYITSNLNLDIRSQVSILGPYFNCVVGSLDDYKGDLPVSINSTCGMDTNPNLAFLKGLVEYCERISIKKLIRKDTNSKISNSNGFAAYPKILNFSATKKARENAIGEAIERYVWPIWWNNTNISYSIYEITKEWKFFLDRNGLFSNRRDINKILLIAPRVDTNYKIYFIYAHIKEKGWVSGGASGLDQNKTIHRAMAELVRHFVGSFDLESLPDDKLDDYNRRLKFFASGEGIDLFLERISTNGSQVLKLPNLVFDSNIKVGLTNSIIALHRAQFDNQPDFLTNDYKKFYL